MQRTTDKQQEKKDLEASMVTLGDDNIKQKQEVSEKYKEL